MADNEEVQLEHLVGPLIADAREAAGLTQAEAAAKAGIHHQTPGDIERGKTRPSFSMLLKLAKIYDVPVASFFPDYGLPDTLSETDILIGDITRNLNHLTPDYLDMLKLITDAMRKRVESDKA